MKISFHYLERCEETLLGSQVQSGGRNYSEIRQKNRDANRTNEVLSISAIKLAISWSLNEDAVCES